MSFALIHAGICPMNQARSSADRDAALDAQISVT
jgi:hypothetical protein